MRMIDRLLLPLAGLAILGLFTPKLHAQIEHGGRPVSFDAGFRSAVVTERLPAVDVAALLEEDAARQEPGPYRFGHVHDVEVGFGSSGVWEELADGGRGWRMRFESPGALSLSFVLARFQIPEGAELFVYDDERTTVHGAYTWLNHQPNGQFAIQPTPGDAVTMEYYEPPGARFPGQLAVQSVVHDYRGVLSILAGSRGGKAGAGARASGACNVDVACPEAAPYPDQVDATVLIQLPGGLCSGALISNTAQDARRLLLSADHCGTLDNAIFYFNYQNSQCGGGTAVKSQSVTGSTRLARDGTYDVRLVELGQPIPESFDVFFAGWDRTDVAPLHTIAIHHPSGDPKKISLDDDPPVKGPDWWHILDWEVGTTEGGSSGSPLFSPEGRIIGQLSGGDADCTLSVNDYYGRMGRQWSLLEPFLDPLATGQTTLDGLDPNLGTDDPLAIASITPDVVECLRPGTAQDVVLRGTGFSDHTTIEVNGAPVDAASFTRWTAKMITLDLPQTDALGSATVAVREGTDVANVTIDVTPAVPLKYQAGDGDPGNYIYTATGCDLILAGQPGDLHLIMYSTNPLASSHPMWELDFGNQFAELGSLSAYVIEAKGWTTINVPVTGIAFTTFFTQTSNLNGTLPIPVSNLQEIFVFL